MLNSMTYSTLIVQLKKQNVGYFKNKKINIMQKEKHVLHVMMFFKKNNFSSFFFEVHEYNA